MIEARWSLVNQLFDDHGIALDYEQILRNNFRKLIRPGEWVADVGAHSGAHTTTLAELVGIEGRVMAIEPLEYFASIVREKFLDQPQVEVMNVALSDFEGLSTFTVAIGTPEESGLRRKPYIFPELAKPEEITIQVRTIDSVLGDWRRLDYVKIDIEGAELDCLKGGEVTISRHRPIISFECGMTSYGQYGKVADDFVAYAIAHDFAIYDLFGHELTAPSRWKAVVDRARTWDFYYVPMERKAWFEQAVFVRSLP